MEINEVKEAMAKVYNKEGNIAKALCLKEGFNEVLKELGNGKQSLFGKAKDLFAD